MPAAGPGAFERLSKMPPAQRQHVLEKLPPERKAKVESRLEEYNNLPPAEKQRLHEQVESFHQLPPEKQDAVRRLFQRFNNLPEERRGTVRQEFQDLRRMSPEDRRARINSDEFRNKFTQNEQHLLDNLAKAMPNQ
jgi:Protein of unknown function (DUF3106).